jgi:hypothetical protein
VTVWPPGLMVSVESTEARPFTVTETFAVWPAWSVPLAGETFTLPSRLDGSEIDQDTGPPEAEMVNVAGPSKLSTIVDGDTETVPGVTAAADEDDGAGWVGAGDGDGDGDFDAEPVGEGELVADLVAAGDVAGLVVAGEVAWVP